MTWLWIVIVFAAFVFIVGACITICLRKDEARLAAVQENGDLRYAVSYARGVFAGIAQQTYQQDMVTMAEEALKGLDEIQSGQRSLPDAETEAVDA